MLCLCIYFRPQNLFKLIKIWRRYRLPHFLANSVHNKVFGCPDMQDVCVLYLVCVCLVIESTGQTHGGSLCHFIIFKYVLLHCSRTYLTCDARWRENTESAAGDRNSGSPNMFGKVGTCHWATYSILRELHEVRYLKCHQPFHRLNDVDHICGMMNGLVQSWK